MSTVFLALYIITTYTRQSSFFRLKILTLILVFDALSIISVCNFQYPQPSIKNAVTVMESITDSYIIYLIFLLYSSVKRHYLTRYVTILLSVAYCGFGLASLGYNIRGYAEGIYIAAMVWVLFFCQWPLETRDGVYMATEPVTLPTTQSFIVYSLAESTVVASAEMKDETDVEIDAKGQISIKMEPPSNSSSSIKTTKLDPPLRCLSYIQRIRLICGTGISVLLCAVHLASFILSSTPTMMMLWNILYCAVVTAVVFIVYWSVGGSFNVREEMDYRANPVVYDDDDEAEAVVGVEGDTAKVRKNVGVLKSCMLAKDTKKDVKVRFQESV